jgi:REP element-mobilizing transposase RayT
LEILPIFDDNFPPGQMNLPAVSHFPDPMEGIFFVTLRLLDALPESFGQNLGLQFYTKQLEFAQSPTRESLLLQTRKRLFARFDEALDLCIYGQSHLSRPKLAELVIEALNDGQASNYKLLTYSILPNHLHVLLQFPNSGITPYALEEFDQIQFEPLRAFVARFQKATERILNHELESLGGHFDPRIFQKRHSTGARATENRFWHERSFDFHIQDTETFEKVTKYMLENQVKDR